MVTDACLNDLRDHIKKKIARTEYRVGSSWYESPLLDIEILTDGTVRTMSKIQHGAACTITAARIVSVDGDVWAQRDVHVILESTTTKLLQWFDFILFESEVNG